MAKFDDLLQAVKVHEVLKSKEENEKKCKFCYVIAAIAVIVAIAAIAAIKRELNGKWALIVVFGQCLIAWLASFVVYHLILLVF